MRSVTTAQKIKFLSGAVNKYGHQSPQVRRSVRFLFTTPFRPEIVGKWLMELSTTDDQWLTVVPLVFEPRYWTLSGAMNLLHSTQKWLQLKTLVEECDPKVLLAVKFKQSRDPIAQFRILGLLVRLVHKNRDGVYVRVFKELFFELLPEISLPKSHFAKKMACWIDSNVVSRARQDHQDLRALLECVKILAAKGN
jgi:hypothetical protein